MSLQIKTFICRKCGKPFCKATGGVMMRPQDLELTLNPICDKCKAKAVAGTIAKIFDSIR